ncbi:MAG: hypothetical protein IPP08_05215 [Chlorobiota bacterium]|jgi:hypothetical protein|nr:hypothetical protein [Chlorobiota bacterium]QQS67565.1 MAG: hypothetical protein IPP08_05215 [Chlorobiota bacterium]
MVSISIESNGRLERTAIYYNGEQISKVKELLINIDEDGTFDSIIKYENTSGVIQAKNIFDDYLQDLITVEPRVSEEEAQNLHLLTIESDGTLNNTMVFINDVQQDGLTGLFIQLKGGNLNDDKSFFGWMKTDTKSNTIDFTFKAEIKFRNEDNSIDTQNIF